MRSLSATAPTLVLFQLELMERDDLPADVSLYREAAGKLEEYTEGQDPVAQPHDPGRRPNPPVPGSTNRSFRVRASAYPEVTHRPRRGTPAGRRCWFSAGYGAGLVVIAAIRAW